MTFSHARSARRALVDSALALLAAGLSMAMFLPSLAAATSASAWREGAAVAVLALLLLAGLLHGPDPQPSAAR